MKSTISNVPYSEVLSLEEKKKLEAQLKEVEILDLDKSMQAYISAQLTDSEMRTFKKLEDDYSARGKINRHAAEFNELEFIPEQCRVKDIRETPIAKSLITIQELLLNYQELALLDTDTSQKSHEYFTNITDELKTFDNETKLRLIEKMLPDTNTAIWMHSKFNPQENPEQYKKRWKELKNSLKARITAYKDELRITDNSNEGYTVMQWAIVLYYINAEKYPDITTDREKIRQFMKDFKIAKKTESNLRNKYSMIKNIFDDRRSSITEKMLQDAKTVLPKIKEINKTSYNEAKNDLIMLQE